MAQSIQSIEALIAGPILELQTGILELQTGLQIYLNETLDNTKPFTERLLVWTRHCCNPA